jgi:hypothetical protein
MLYFSEGAPPISPDPLTPQASLAGAYVRVACASNGLRVRVWKADDLAGLYAPARAWWAHVGLRVSVCARVYGRDLSTFLAFGLAGLIQYL